MDFSRVLRGLYSRRSGILAWLSHCRIRRWCRHLRRHSNSEPEKGSRARPSRQWSRGMVTRHI